MTLSIGLQAALSGLATTAEQTSVVSRNVARAGDANASRKIANLISLPGGGVRLATVTRASNEALLEKMLGATSSAGTQRAIAQALDRLDQTSADPEFDASPAALVAKLAGALQMYASAPQDSNAARSAVSAAANLANTLNDATKAVQHVRGQADADIAAGVGQVNDLLAKFHTVNAAVVNGTRAGRDVTDYLDQRDQILAGLSEQLGVRTITRADNDMAIFTDGGVTLFDTVARSVTFSATPLYTAGTTGNAVYVDGVPITGNTGTMLSGSGRLTGLATVRDNIATTYQSQLDEIARGLIGAFAESDQSATPTLPDVPGLFTYDGAPAMPASGTVLTGIAGSIRVSASVDPAQGGNANLLRDGGIAGNPAYVYNATGASGYSDRLQQLFSGLGATQAFDVAAQAGTSAAVGSYAASSVAWLQSARQSASADADYSDTLLQRSSDALSKETGVSLDEEMTLLLELERSYQASSKLIATIDNMLGALLQTVR